MSSFTSINPSGNVGYSTYKSKRHSRTSSASVVPTEQIMQDPELQEKLSQDLTARINGIKMSANGRTTPTFNVGSPASSQGLTTPPPNAIPSQAFFYSESQSPSPSTRATSPNADVARAKSLSPVPTSFAAADRNVAPERPLGSPQPGQTVEPLLPPIPDLDESKASPVEPSSRLLDMSLLAPSPTSDPSPVASPSTSVGSQPSLKPSVRSTTSTFRRVPLKASKLTAPSPLRPSSSVRTLSSWTAASAPLSVHHPTSRVFASPDASSSSPRAFPSSAASSRPQSQLSLAPPITISRLVTPAVPSPAPSPASVPASNDKALPAPPPRPSLSPSTSTPARIGSISTAPPLQVGRQFLPGHDKAATAPVTPTALSGASTPIRTAGVTPSTISTSTTASGASKPALAPYRPGFQPKGVYSPRTDEFMSLRSKRFDDKRAEDKRLLRRLEKLVELHFPVDGNGTVKAPQNSRRSSSFFDFSELKGKNASDIWKGVVESASATKNDRYIRDTEQTITRWEDDKAVSACPICSQSFHPLTNRKHHCRTCGRVICSLPPKLPIRPQKCSLLIAADRKTGRIVEVPETIAYGVSRAGSGVGTPGSPTSGREKDGERQGIRICRDCNIVIHRQQFNLEANHVPPVARLHRGLIRIEQQIQENLPQLQELLLNAAHGDITLDRGAMATRKELLDMFGEYDIIAKRIKALPTVGGSSQEKLQSAIMMRASLFLQQHMFPLKRLAAVNAKHAQGPSSQSSSATSSGTDLLTPNGAHGGLLRVVDVDSELAHTLQPLLEQEALLESYVDEAMQARKFEDAQTLKSNLDEIRMEIDRIARDGKIGRA